MSRVSVFLIVVLLALAAHFFRYSVNPVSRADNWPLVYVLDRWTGEVTVCQQTKCHSTKSE